MRDLRFKMEAKVDIEEFKSTLNEKSKRLQKDFENSTANIVTAMGKLNQTMKRKEEENKSTIKVVKKEQKKTEERLRE